jgi:tetratricopeptide (TPR) repeat protein
VRDFGFVNYDDPDYVTNNPHVQQGLTADGAAWAFTSGEAANWFPLTRLSHMLDVQLFGMAAGWHHFTNVLLHALASVLLFLFLNRATRARWPSAFVALLFALHPMHVESVAWIAERKDVLCALFWFLALWAYVSNRRVLTVAAFCLGMMSKPMIVTLPFTLMLLDVWPLRRPVGVRDKLPLFAITAAGAAVTYAVQHASGAVKAIGTLGIGNALVSYIVYLAKFVWPSGLAVFYPYPTDLPLWEPLAAAIALVGITAAVLHWRREYPYLLVGWLWFLGTLVPVIGIVQVGAQARADRYLYVPMVGLGIMVAWGTADLFRKRPRVVAAAAAAVCLAFAGAASAQIGYWHDSGTLFAHAIAVTDGNYIAEHNLGAYLMEQPGHLSDALPHLQAAVRLRPDSGTANSDLGAALAKVPERLPEAIAALQTAARLLPDSAIPRNNLGNAYTEAGRFPEAVAEYQAALRIQPDYADARNNLARVDAERHYQAGLALAKSGDAQKAAAELEQALRIKPDYAEAHNNLGVVLSQIPGRQPEAVQHFREAVRLRPDYDDARYNLDLALKSR